MILLEKSGFFTSKNRIWTSQIPVKITDFDGYILGKSPIPLKAKEENEMPTNLKKFEENRKQNIRKTIRFTDNEFKAVQEKMQMANITSLNDYLAK